MLENLNHRVQKILHFTHHGRNNVRRITTTGTSLDISRADWGIKHVHFHPGRNASPWRSLTKINKGLEKLLKMNKDAIIATTKKASQKQSGSFKVGFGWMKSRCG